MLRKFSLTSSLFAKLYILTPNSPPNLSSSSDFLRRREATEHHLVNRSSHDCGSLTMIISTTAVFLFFLPSALAQCSCTQGSRGLDMVLLVDTDSASMAGPIDGRNPLDYAKNFLTQLLFSNGMDISSNDKTGVRVAVFGINATGAFATKATLNTPDNPNTSDTVRNAINNLIPDNSTDPTVDIDDGFLRAQNLFDKTTLGHRPNIRTVVITISSSSPSTVAISHAILLQTQFGTTMIGIAVGLSGSPPDYSVISSQNAAFTVTSLSPNGFDALTSQILGLLCAAEGFCGGASTPTPTPGLPNQHKQCQHGSAVWPQLWVDVVLLIDSSAAQNKENFDNMVGQIQEIWAPNTGGPIVSQATARTRVGVVAFDTSARVVAPLDRLNSNQELFDALSGLTQNTSTTVDSSNALQTASTLFGTNVPGDRPNAPNVIIVYTADWAGPDPCQIAEFIQQSAVVVVVRYKNRNEGLPQIPSCVYSPGEIYEASNSDLDEILLESLAYANCFCIGQRMPGNHGRSKRQKDSRADHQIWTQFWLPNKTDNNYYLREKFAECAIQATSASVNYATAQTGCHKDGSYLPNEFSPDKHTFLLNLGLAGRLLTQWNGLQYNSNLRQWYWDYYDPILNQSSQIPARPGDYTNWNCNNQPVTSNNQYCVANTPGIGGCNGFRWSTAQCTSFQALYHNQYLCQQDACDASNYCSNS